LSESGINTDYADFRDLRFRYFLACLDVFDLAKAIILNAFTNGLKPVSIHNKNLNKFRFQRDISLMLNMTANLLKILKQV